MVGRPCASRASKKTMLVRSRQSAGWRSAGKRLLLIPFAYRPNTQQRAWPLPALILSHELGKGQEPVDHPLPGGISEFRSVPDRYTRLVFLAGIRVGYSRSSTNRTN